MTVKQFFKTFGLSFLFVLIFLFSLGLILLSITALILMAINFKNAWSEPHLFVYILINFCGLGLSIVWFYNFMEFTYKVLDY